ncbi:MAG: BamA/TamA family outer membrane protein [Flavobacteriales bacterium]|nr:BamA/TamA family outer membrane protein [Flavobacteriales bacterium]
MHIRAAHITLLLACWAAWTGCDPTKRVPQGKHLLVKNKVQVQGQSVDREELRNIIKQKPNKKILGLRFYLTMYNLPNPDRVARKKARKLTKNEARNEKRAAKGKAAKYPGRTFGEWMQEVVGEAPTVLDSSLTARSTEQLVLYLKRKGYFDATGTDTTTFSGRKASVGYRLDTGKPYLLRNVTYTVDDPQMERYMEETWAGRKVKAGDRFDADVLDKERERVSGVMRELGYLYFNKNLVAYEADTTVGDHQVDLKLRIERPRTGRSKRIRGTPEGRIYHVNDVTIDITERVEKGIALRIDSLNYRDFSFRFNGDKPLLRPRALLTSVFFKPGDRYQQSMNDLTFRRLTNLRVFDRVDINYDSTSTRADDEVNCRIRLIPAKRQSFSVEGYGTNRGGFLGTSFSLAYRHRNLLRTMGSVQAKIVVGLEAQQSITQGNIETTTTSAERSVFNTIEIGPEITLRFPQFLLPIARERFARSSYPRTNIVSLYNLQQRPDYNRSLLKFTFGYEWNETLAKTWMVNPIEVNVIRIPFRSPEFEEYLRSANDPVLTDSYTDHLIIGSRIMYTWNTQQSLPQRDVFFLRAFLETSGNTIRALSPLLGLNEVTDSTGTSFYTIAGVRYAQFVKLDGDFRYYRRIHERSGMAFRLSGGVGVPLSNLNVLPFETSYFVGGANGLRAWQARSLGPGSFRAPLVAFDRIGELRMEANAEYRFNLIGFFESAFFVDVGNIWYLREDDNRPGSGFSSSFLSELAIGTGLGLRLNFDFFLVRFDLGLQTKDPSYAPGQRWLWERNGDERGTQLLNLNLGIGYPF